MKNLRILCGHIDIDLEPIFGNAHVAAGRFECMGMQTDRSTGHGKTDEAWLPGANAEANTGIHIVPIRTRRWGTLRRAARSEITRHWNRKLAGRIDVQFATPWTDLAVTNSIVKRALMSVKRCAGIQ